MGPVAGAVEGRQAGEEERGEERRGEEKKREGNCRALYYCFPLSSRTLCLMQQSTTQHNTTQQRMLR